MQSRGWRNDPEEAAYAIRAYAGSPSFPETLGWVARNHAMPAGLDRIECPFLVIWGSWDVLLIPRMAARWERLVPAPSCASCPAGHVPFCDDPDTVADAITDFTARAGARQEAPGADQALARAARNGAGITAAATITSTKAKLWMTIPIGSLGIGSPKTRIPPLMADTLAAALVSVMTGTASPFWRPRAEA